MSKQNTKDMTKTYNIYGSGEIVCHIFQTNYEEWKVYFAYRYVKFEKYFYFEDFQDDIVGEWVYQTAKDRDFECDRFYAKYTADLEKRDCHLEK